METVARPPVDAELNLLTDWGNPYSESRTKTAAVLSVAAHVAVILAFVVLPPELFRAAPRETPAASHRLVTPLIDPPTELTQKAPNKGKVSKEFSAEITPRPRIHAPPPLPAPSNPAPAPPQRAALPAAPKPVPKAAPAEPLPEPPKVDANKEPPKTDLPQMPAPSVPQIQPAEKPKLALENVSGPPPPVPPGRSAVPIPGSAVDGAIRQATRGDGNIAGMNLPPSVGSPASQLQLPQLLSDPQGVDFKPYLIRVLASVRLHWMAILPESVRYGRRGSVAIQFSIARDGNVPKLVIATPSGTDALDKAAVAGISASVPFPPLPTDFKGDRIVLQFNFAYNMPKQ